MPRLIAQQDGMEVTIVAPCSFSGDLRPVELEPEPADSAVHRLVGLPMRLPREVHISHYPPGRLRALLQTQPYDLIYCWEEPFVAAGWQVARYKPAASALVYASFQNLSKRYPPPFSWMEAYALRKACAWTAFGQTGLQTLERKPLYRNVRHALIPVGIDLDAYRPDPAARARVRGELGWDEGAPVVGFAGRFIKEKGLSFLLDCLDRVRVPWRALFIGGGTLEAPLRAWAARCGDQVRVTTGVRHEEMPAYFNALDVLCVPSLTTAKWREQFGRVLIEAFACGVAVMASDSGEIPHVVGQAGVIVAEGNQDAWVAALTAWLSDPAQLAARAAAGLARAREVYAWPAVTQQHLRFFEECLDHG